MADEQATIIYHVTNEEGIDQASRSGRYSCDSLGTEGFIHCCSKDQLSGVLDRYYKGVEDLRLMEIDTNVLAASLVFENTVGGEELFPHVYGEINMDAVTDVVAL